MPAVKLGRNNTSRNLSRLIYGYVKERGVKLDDLMMGTSGSGTRSSRRLLQIRAAGIRAAHWCRAIFPQQTYRGDLTRCSLARTHTGQTLCR